MNHLRHLWRTVSAMLLVVLPLLAQSQTAVEPIGYVKTVTGEAWIANAGERVKAAPGTAVLIGSQLGTGADSAMGVSFKDNTVMSIGPKTELTVEEYLYAPAQGQLSLITRLGMGTLNYVSGVIAKLKPEAVTVKTPAGIIGVRGTQFVAKVEQAQ
jgi:hypothetical protein